MTKLEEDQRRGNGGGLTPSDGARVVIPEPPTPHSAIIPLEIGIIDVGIVVWLVLVTRVMEHRKMQVGFCLQAFLNGFTFTPHIFNSYTP